MRRPVEIKRLSDAGLKISWSDGTEANLSAEALRKSCPCASCRESRGDTSHASPLTPKKRSLSVIQNTKEESLRIESIWAVGNYALGIKWGDGHDDGIFSYELLASLK